jgi:hypothetical protein
MLWGMGRRREEHPFEDNPFIDGLLEWMGSPEGQRSIEALDVVWPLLEEVAIDAKSRKLIWPDGARLSIAQSVRRIHADHPEFPADLIESKVVSYIESFAPPDYSQEQLDELDRLADSWVDDHERRAITRQKQPRTRHS